MKVLALDWSRARVLGGIALFAALTALTARVVIPLPFTPVPVTLQVLAVLLAGLTLGARGGAASQLAYLTAIALGLPLSARGLSGPAAFLGPTGGYLIAFAPAAYVVGALARPGWRVWMAALAGIGVIYLGGASWLAVWLGGDWGKAWTMGVAPFIVVDLGKALVAAAVADGARRLVGPTRTG
ncbi:MAG: biotin transporter BioY [Chloroflexi bacterium]|nr:biotin transporter BioY [Chloroflexota bacterium]